jgi:imidazole glycerol-phosphate synthase subunit HisH
MRREVVIVPTGTANTASVVAALGRSGASTRVAADATEVELADNVVLPGVGSFGSAMSRIDELGMRTVLMQRVEAGRPTLAICLGMQLLCAGSAESPAARGLGVVPGTVGRFTGEVLVPQLGWNRVVPGHETRVGLFRQLLPAVTDTRGLGRRYE